MLSLDSNFLGQARLCAAKAECRLHVLCLEKQYFYAELFGMFVVDNL